VLHVIVIPTIHTLLIIQSVAQVSGIVFGGNNYDDPTFNKTNTVSHDSRLLLAMHVELSMSKVLLFGLHGV